MASPLTVVRNDYHKNKKPSTIYTPVGVSQFLFGILTKPEVPTFLTILDPAIGGGRLTDPWKAPSRTIIGCDIVDPRWSQSKFQFIKGKFEEIDQWPQACPYPDLVLCNPPFNNAPGRRLYPEVFLEKIFTLFGVTTPVVMFVPMGMLLNQRRKSRRWRWLRDCGAEITSIVSLPLDTFEGVEFHVEILIFNVTGLKSHYFLTEKSIG
jgi:hypothetical protein